MPFSIPHVLRPSGLPLALFAVLACGHAAAPLSAQDPRPQDDWASLARYREANARLGAPRPGEQRVVFYGNSITDAWAEHFETMFPGKPYVGRGISVRTSSRSSPQ
jgi:hypothetical protein